MTEWVELRKTRENVNDSIRDITIDLNQAGNYFARSQYRGFRTNLDQAIKRAQQLMLDTRSIEQEVTE